MSKKITYSVTIAFSEKVQSDSDIMEIAENIARAIKGEANSGLGISPESADYFTESILIKPQFLDKEIFVPIVD